MLKTKIAFKNNKYCLLVGDDNGKFKQTYSDINKKIVEKERAKLLTKDETIVKKDLVKYRFVERYKEFAQYKLDLADQPSSRLQRTSVSCYMATYNKCIKGIVPEDMQIKEFNSLYAKSFFLQIRNKGRTWKSAKSSIKHIKTFMKYALDNGWIIYNPLAVFSVHSHPELLPKTDAEMRRVRPTTMNRNEVRHLFNSVIPKNPDSYDQLFTYTLVTTFAFTGMRASEIAGLTWNAIDFYNNRLNVELTVVYSEIRDRGKKSASQRGVVMPKTLKSVLLRWRSIWEKYNDKNTQWVFPSLKTQTPLCYNAIRNRLLIAYQTAGFAKLSQGSSGDTKYFKVIENKFKGCTSKTFRHFASTALLNARRKHSDLHDNFIKRQIGHEDIRTTEKIYGDHIIDAEYSDEAINQQKAIDEIFDFGIELPTLKD